MNELSKLEKAFDAKYGKAAQAWEAEAKRYHLMNPNFIDHKNKDQSRAASELVFNTIGEYFLPHSEIIGKATSAGINAFLTVAPTWLLVKTSREIFRQLNRKDTKVAKQLLYDIQTPLSEDFVPAKVIELQSKIARAWTQELYTLDAKD